MGADTVGRGQFVAYGRNVSKKRLQLLPRALVRVAPTHSQTSPLSVPIPIEQRGSDFRVKGGVTAQLSIEAPTTVNFACTVHDAASRKAGAEAGFPHPMRSAGATVRRRCPQVNYPTSSKGWCPSAHRKSDRTTLTPLPHDSGDSGPRRLSRPLRSFSHAVNWTNPEDT